MTEASNRAQKNDLFFNGASRSKSFFRNVTLRLVFFPVLCYYIVQISFAFKDVRNVQKKAVIVQDLSCFGKCSSAVALPIVSRFNIECAVLPTALLSVHTGFSKFTCFDLTEEMKKIVEDWNELSLSFDGFFSGYMLSQKQAEIALFVLEKLLKKGGLVLVDPVMGDDGKPYSGLGDSFCEKMRELVSRADVITPNLTEAALLLEREPVLSDYDEAYIKECLFELKKLGCKTPMLTGVSFEKEKIGVAFLENGEVQFVFSKRHEGVKCGTGDAFSSVLFGALMSGEGTRRAVERAVFSVERAISNGVKDYGIDFESVLGSLC